jgi:hypothetical protein
MSILSRNILTLTKHFMIVIPATLTADAGYGSEENFELLDHLNIDGYVKYTSFDKDQRGKDEPFKSENFHYNKELDCFYCPMGQQMKRVKEGKRVTTTGFEQQVSPLSGSCAVLAVLCAALVTPQKEIAQ